MRTLKEMIKKLEEIPEEYHNWEFRSFGSYCEQSDDGKSSHWGVSVNLSNGRNDKMFKIPDKEN